MIKYFTLVFYCFFLTVIVSCKSDSVKIDGLYEGTFQYPSPAASDIYDYIINFAKENEMSRLGYARVGDSKMGESKFYLYRNGITIDYEIVMLPLSEEIKSAKETGGLTHIYVQRGCGLENCDDFYEFSIIGSWKPVDSGSGNLRIMISRDNKIVFKIIGNSDFEYQDTFYVSSTKDLMNTIVTDYLTKDKSKEKYWTLEIYDKNVTFSQFDNKKNIITEYNGKIKSTSYHEEYNKIVVNVIGLDYSMELIHYKKGNYLNLRDDKTNRPLLLTKSDN